MNLNTLRMYNILYFRSLAQCKMRLSATEAELHSAMEEYTTGMHTDRQKYEAETAALMEQLEKAGNADDLEKIREESEK